MRKHPLSAYLPEILLIVLASAARLIPHPPNFTPIGALALVGGFGFGRRRNSLLAPLIALFIGDLFLGVHGLTPSVYLSFALIVALGAKFKSSSKFLLASVGPLLSASLFFVITNFAVWTEGQLYPRTLQGLGTCFAAGIPFFWNSLAGDFVFTAALLLVYTAASSVWKPASVRTSKA